jgi:glucose-1-phosphate cytidylyltransferase
MQVVILCGGKGTRAYPYTDSMPKPMLPVDGTPILMHVMRIYAEQGHTDFILSVGYLKEVIGDYFHDKQMDWQVRLVDTGAETGTGGRIQRCAHLLDDTFFATYADGLCDVSLADLLAFHRSHPGHASVTSIPLPTQYGTIELDDAGRIHGFHEKPVLREHWVNAGFFVFDKVVFGEWEGDDLEREVFPALAGKGLLYAYRHDGFFRSLDSYKDHQEIEQLVVGGQAPWGKQT